MKKLERFYPVHSHSFDTALSEIQSGCKRSHWMWYIFPQLRGLGSSPTAYIYGLSGLEEAQAFAEDPILGCNLRRITQALLDQPKRNAFGIFGDIDALKLRSCMLQTMRCSASFPRACISTLTPLQMRRCTP